MSDIFLKKKEKINMKYLFSYTFKYLLIIIIGIKKLYKKLFFYILIIYIINILFSILNYFKIKSCILKYFYEEYKIINLQLKNQVIATKR